MQLINVAFIALNQPPIRCILRYFYHMLNTE